MAEHPDPTSTPSSADDPAGRVHRLDIVAGEPPAPPRSALVGRPSIGVWFSCANRYVTVWRDVRGHMYTARCPTCGQTMRFRVGEGGEKRRIFELTCR